MAEQIHHPALKEVSASQRSYLEAFIEWAREPTDAHSDARYVAFDAMESEKPVADAD